MSTPDVTPTPVPVISAPPAAAPFDATLAVVHGDVVAASKGAIDYLCSALEAAKTSEKVLVAQATDDAVALAFQVAAEHGFEAYLAIFKTSIEAGAAQVQAGISDQTIALLDKGIASLKGLQIN